MAEPVPISMINNMILTTPTQTPTPTTTTTRIVEMVNYKTFMSMSLSFLSNPKIKK